ncbi:hypothetical protein FALCPG4_014683 [Fusarium falciforme]
MKAHPSSFNESIPIMDRETLDADIEEVLKMELRKPDGDQGSNTKPPELQQDLGLGDLYEEIYSSLEAVLMTMKSTLEDSQVDNFVQLYNVLLALQHWQNDIKPVIDSQAGHGVVDTDSVNPLIDIERGYPVCSPHQRHFGLRSWACSGLKRQLQNYVEASQQGENCAQIIDDLESQVKSLKAFIYPLRTRSEVSMNVGHVARLQEEVTKITKSRRRTRATKRTISQRMAGCLKESYFDSAPRTFLPAGIVEQFIRTGSRDDVVQKLKANESEADQDLVDFVRSDASQLFATVVNMGFDSDDLYNVMESFKYQRVSDSCLPILPDTPLRKASTGKTAVNGLQDIDEIWDTGRCKRFYDSQWEILVPKFSTDTPNQDLNQRAVLPFIEKHRDSKRGGFGEVYKVMIHEGHIKDPANTFDTLPKYYAVKHISPNPATQHDTITRFWEKEAKNLMGMMKRKVQHTVRFVTAFRRGDGGQDGQFNHYLICEWADGGSLQDVWERISQPSLDINLVREAIPTSAMEISNQKTSYASRTIQYWAL